MEIMMIEALKQVRRQKSMAEIIGFACKAVLSGRAPASPCARAGEAEGRRARG